MLGLHPEDREEVVWMRKKIGSWRHLVFQGAVLATMLLAAGARWKSHH
jgi:hypothetical protein